MRIVDAGHRFWLDSLDGDFAQELVFVKRQGPGYPGNVGAHAGTNIQEVLRALISRVDYLDAQIPDDENLEVIRGLRAAFCSLERRAARRHGRPDPNFGIYPERKPVCPTCGHVGCSVENHVKEDAQ